MAANRHHAVYAHVPCKQNMTMQSKYLIFLILSIILFSCGVEKAGQKIGKNKGSISDTDLAKEVFLSLCTERKILGRIRHILKNSKTLRN